jgi:hypothetical protein
VRSVNIDFFIFCFFIRTTVKVICSDEFNNEDFNLNKLCVSEGVIFLQSISPTGWEINNPAVSRQGFFFVAEEGLFHDPFWVTAQVKIPAGAFGVCRVFLFLSLTRASSARSKNKNPKRFCARDFNL